MYIVYIYIYASIQYSWCLDPFVAIETGMMNTGAWGYDGMWIAGDSRPEYQAQDFYNYLGTSISFATFC